MAENIGEKAVRCLRLLESYDFTGVQEMCTETATVWHNDGSGEQLMGEKLEQLRLLVGGVRSLRYEIIRQFFDSDEVLQQQVLRAITADGTVNEIHATMYFRFDGGLIDRIEEYSYAVPAGR
ncbi:nuclear transport factor 2 family protein [Spongiactinospora rosea]|uniref:Nuclear transport factor 2 family protein n=1 Tax=Spongiactinospora rosea TaxID=2248750 RepID=A0A366LNZ4_9ACTN|nr:nuclear transport factor 2 family protein [Spongiactinospora rosea]RBQ15631.1 nuclear transport factor 2 family protein [Spongiactinospora rosea]